MSERDFREAMAADPVLREDAGMPPMPDEAAEGEIRCPMCGASASKIEQAAQGGQPPMGGGMMGRMK